MADGDAPLTDEYLEVIRKRPHSASSKGRRRDFKIEDLLRRKNEA